MTHTIGYQKIRNGLWQVVIDGSPRFEMSSKCAAARDVEQIKKNYLPTMPQGIDVFYEYDKAAIEWVDTTEEKDK